jgi:hypothetical protein
MKIRHVSLKIANGSSASDPVEVHGDLLGGIYLPAAVDGTLSIKANHPVSGSFVAFQDVSFTASAYVPLTPSDTFALAELRLETSVAQTADREFVLAFRQS